jgi:MFS family permease
VNKTFLQTTKNHRDSDVLSIQKEHLFSGYHARLLLILTLGATLAKFSKLVLPPLLPVITADLSITPAIAGGALSLLTLTSAFLQYPGGKFSDHLSRKTVLVVSFLLLITGCIILLSVPTYWAFIIGVIVIGACDGLFHTPARSLLSDFYITKRNRAFGIHLIAIDLAGIFAALVAIVVVATWRAVFIPVLFAAIGVLILYHTSSRGHYVFHPVPLEFTSTMKRLFRSRSIRQLTFVNGLFSFVLQGFIGFLPLFLQTYHGFSISFAAGGFALLFAIGLFVKPLSGELADKFGGTKITIISLLLISIGILSLLFFSNFLLIFGGIAVIAIGQKAFTPPMQSILLDAVSRESNAGDYGAVRTIFIGIGSMGPLYIGIMATLLGYEYAFAGFAFCMLIGAFILYRLGTKYTHNSANTSP